MNLHLHIDPFSGIAGDMFLGALIDLGLDLNELVAILAGIPASNQFTITAEKVLRTGITATDLQVLVNKGHTQHHHDHGHAHHHHSHTRFSDIMHMIDHLSTTDRGKARARQIVQLLAEAEAKIHGLAVDDIHFHEVGAIDSIVDMLGAAVALELLGIESISSGPLPLSRGLVNCAHGTMPVPAPATMLLCKDLPVFGVDRTGELVTPTGAAIVKALCEQFGPPPPMIIRHIGYGAGDRQNEEKVPNVLRLILGEKISPGDMGPLSTTNV